MKKPSIAPAFYGLVAVYKREMASFFRSPLAFLFVSAFVVLSAALTFYLSDFFTRNEADLLPFFRVHPYLYVLLLPAFSAGLWAEERRQGTIELMLTLPIGTPAAVLGKFLASWSAAAFALFCTLPLWLTICILGQPDQGLVLSGYLGSLLLAGGFLAIGSCVSAWCRHQVVAYMATLLLCGGLLLSGVGTLLQGVSAYLPPLAMRLLLNISAFEAFDRFVRGMIDARSVVYFGLNIVVWLLAAMVAVTGLRHANAAVARVRRHIYALLLLLLLCGSLLAALTLRGYHIDTTADKRHTLDVGTQTMLRAIEEPLTLRLYVSRRGLEGMAGFQSYAERVRDRLYALADAANGKVIIEEVRPEPFSEEEDAALTAGLTGLTLPDGGTVFFGLVGENRTDGFALIPLLAPEREAFLDYDLVRLIDGLQQIERPKIGMLTSLPLATGNGGVAAALQGQARPYALYRELQQRYDVVPLNDDLTTVPLSNLQAVVLVHPRPLNKASQYKLDQYALSGGKLLVFTDPLSEVDVEQSEYNVVPPQSSDLNTLLSAYGVMMVPQTVVLDPERARSVTVPNATQPVAYAAWLALRQEDLTATDAAIGNIGGLSLGSAGVLQPLPKEGVTLTPLVQTSAAAGTVPLATLLAADPTRVVLPPATGRQILAARLSGTCPSAFGDKAPDGVTITAPHIGKGACNIITVADADLWDDRFWLLIQQQGVQKIGVPFAGNADFAMNALDSLVGRIDLTSLRGRGTAHRPLLLTNALRLEADKKARLEEQALMQKINDARARLQNNNNNAALSAEDTALRADLLRSRKALRAIRQNLNADLDSLYLRIKLINMLGTPLLLGGASVLLQTLRRRHKHLVSQ